MTQVVKVFKSPPPTFQYRPHTGQALVHLSTARFRLVVCGRKWGKTIMDIAEAFRWLGKPETLVWWVAPYQGVAKIGLRRFIKYIPPVFIKNFDRRDFRVDMVNGSEIYFKSSDNPDGLVGEGIDLMILDEASRIRESTWEETLYPNLDDPSRVGHLLATTTPRGHNWIYKAWVQGIRHQNNWESWGEPLTRLPLTDERVEDVMGGWPSWKSPYFSVSRLQDALKKPKRIFLQEYGARFLEDLGAVFHSIYQCVSGKFEPPISGEEYYAGVDLGKTESWTTVFVVNSQNHVVAFDRFKQISWPAQVKRIIETVSEYQATVLLESTGLGDPIFDFVKLRYPHVQSIKITNERKQELIENLVMLISTGKVTYPDIPELIEELSLFGADRTPGGQIKYEAPRGFTDDCVLGLALATWQNIKSAYRKLSFEFVEL
jgi:hypothetical protein